MTAPGFDSPNFPSAFRVTWGMPFHPLFSFLYPGLGAFHSPFPSVLGGQGVQPLISLLGTFQGLRLSPLKASGCLLCVLFNPRGLFRA